MLSPDERVTIATYDQIAAEWNEINSDPNFWAAEFQKFRRFLPQGKIIDIGCGGGRDALLFTENGYKYLGIDLSDGMFRQARKLAPKARFLRMDMYALGFQAKTFDGFWAVASLLHIRKAKVGLVLEEIKRITKPNGIGLFIQKEGKGEVPIGSHGGGRFFSLYTGVEFLEILAGYGFQIIEQARTQRASCLTGQQIMWLIYFVRAL